MNANRAIVTGLEIISAKDVETIGSHDVGVLSDNDCAQLCICLNAWAHLTWDLTGDRLYADRLSHVLQRNGLVSVCQVCDALHQSLALEEDITSSRYTFMDIADIAIRIHEHSGVQDLNVWLRFPRRFTYADFSAGEKATIEKFRAANKACYSPKDFYESWRVASGTTRVGYTVIREVASIIKSMIGEAPTHLPKGVMSSGVTSEGCRTPGDRMRVIAASNNYYDAPPTYHILTDWSTSYGLARTSTVGVMVCVPKTLTARRLIKPEPAARAFYSSRVRLALEASLRRSKWSRYINWDDQGVNLALAKSASASNEYATVDLTMASDTISRAYTFEVLPLSWRPLFYNSITDYVDLGDGTIVSVRCFSTSGNQLTWLWEAIFFLALATYASSLCGSKLPCYAYGDDLEVPCDVVDTLQDLLELFGCKMNREKSYSSETRFRESCGGEFLAGLDITPIYWPRRVLKVATPKEEPSCIASLCSLQHRLFHFRRAAWYIEAVCKKVDPRITYSAYGSECDDLWDGDRDPVDDQFTDHRCLIQRCPQIEWRNRSSALAAYRYYQFLETGPTYLDEQSRAMGLSSPLLNPSDFTKPDEAWVTRHPYYDK